jgi:hypothetical protein
MPIAICPECCRDYYLPGESIEGARCERCGSTLVPIEALGQDLAGGPGETPEPSGQELRAPPDPAA